VDVAMWIDASSAALKNGPRVKHSELAGISPGPPGINPKEGRMEVIPVTLAIIDSISTVLIRMPKDLKSIDQRLDLRKTVEEVERRFPEGIPNLDPIKNMSIKDESFKTLVRVILTTITLTIENRGHGVTIDRKSFVPFSTSRKDIP
jgi:ATP-dependent RNA helicase DOB1